jgi:hypothetical protein
MNAAGGGQCSSIREIMTLSYSKKESPVRFGAQPDMPVTCAPVTGALRRNRLIVYAIENVRRHS